MKRMGLLLIVAGILSGCTVGGILPRAKPEPIAMVSSCPQPKSYPKLFQAQVATEVRAHRAEIPAIMTLVGDYGALRGALKDCGKSSPP